jgi:Protein of unknown function (DUF551)
MNWQLIETAPKDGYFILGYPFFDRVAIAKWYCDGWYVDAGSQDGMGYENTPLTHWMPLPETPNK